MRGEPSSESAIGRERIFLKSNCDESVTIQPFRIADGWVMLAAIVSMRQPPLQLDSSSARPRKWLPGSRLTVVCATAAALLAGAAHAGDILRGGATTTSARENSAARNNSGAEAAAAARTRAQDRLSRTTKAVADMRQLQEAARAAAGDGGVPDGLVINGLERYQPGEANFRWDGAGAPVQAGNDVTITQNLQQAILHWKTFNVGKNTQVNFDQSAGGADSGKWIAFNKVLGSVAPSQIRGKIKADGQVYIINQSGIIFGAGSQVNARTLVASTLPINDNLVKQGLLNNPDAQFLFSGLTVPGGSDGTLAFVPPAPVTPDGRIRDVVVEAGASLTATVTQDGNGGRVMLVGPNVQNSGEISTPNGQAILAAGLQVGVQAHDGDDPSLRGLDVWVGAVGDYGGAVVNNGIVSAPTGSIWLGGKQIRQGGVVQATTSVALNGRIDIKASYGAVSNANYDNSGNAGFGGPIFLNQFTGDVIFAENSSTSILPEYSSDKTVPGSALPQRSHVELDGSRVYFAPDSALFVPNGRVIIRAGIWPYKDADGDRTTLVVTNPLTGATTPEPGLGNYFSGPTQNFLFSSGQVYLDRGASLSVAGTTEVLVPLTQSILEVQFRGGELADSPLQRDGTLRGKSLNVDIRKTGEYDGRYWVGTPLGDVVGLAGLVGKNVSQLTTRGGDISISAGTSIVTQPGSELDVSGGYVRHGGGMVRTSRVRIGGQLVKIEDATPDRLYDEIYSGQSTQTHSKWGVTRTFKSALAPTGDYKELPYIEGAAAGSLTLTAPSMAVDGALRGTTIQGPRQRSEIVGLSSLNLNFRAQKIDLTLAQPYQTIRPTPPAITFASQSTQVAAGVFEFGSDPSAPLPASRVAEVTLSPDLYTTSGFGDISIDNTDGSVTVPADVTVTTLPLGSLSVTASNISIAGKIRSPGGSLQFKATNLTTVQLATPNAGPALLANANAGVFSLAAGAVLSTAGFIIDDRPNARAVGFVPLVTNGGSVSIESFSAFLAPSSSIDVAGGVAASTSGSISYGDAGSISIKTGLDPTAPSVLGGQLILGSTLSGYSGGKGGSLEIQAMLIQIGTGRALPNGPATLTFPAFGTQPETLQVVDPLVLAPEFFQQGGFTSYSLIGIGAGEYTAKGPDGEVLFPPAVYVEPGTSITPVAESLRAVKFPGRGGDLSVTRVLLPEGQRKAVSLSMQALGSDDLFTLDRLEARADIVIGQGASIQTDAGATISLQGGTVSMLGTLVAPGGRITIRGASDFPATASQRSQATSALPTVYIGPDARISAAGKTVNTPDKYGRRKGTVYGGGKIGISGNIVAEAGAILDVSGTSAVMDLDPLQVAGQATRPTVVSGLNTPPWQRRSIPVQVDSNGGTIELTGSRMLFSDATLLGFAGGPTAIGGKLSILSGRYYLPADIQTSADINLVVTADGSTLPASSFRRGVGLPIKDANGVGVPGMGYFTAQKFSNGGFDSLDLGFAGTQSVTVDGNVEFKGPVTINVPGNLRLAGGGIIKADSAVSLTAAYIGVGQPLRAPVHPSDELFFPFTSESATGTHYLAQPTAGPGSVTFSASFIDVGTLSLQNIQTTTFVANNGDIRGSGTVAVAGELNLVAAQIYPTTSSAFNIFAYDHANGRGTVNISRSGVAQAPLSAGGVLGIYASVINQGGVLLAPFGQINLGWDGTDFDPTEQDDDRPFDPVGGSRYNTLTRTFETIIAPPVASSVVLRSGSITSVAGIDSSTGEELLIPYGLTADGLSWIDPRGVNVTTSGIRAKSVRIAGDSVVTESGSTIDIRGGGDLLAYRWLPGNGGGIDRLGSAGSSWSGDTVYESGTIVSYNGKTWSARVRIDPEDFTDAQFPTSVPQPGSVSRYWTLISDSFAVLPNFGSKAAPISPFNTGLNSGELGGDPGLVSNLAIGDKVYLAGGAGLDAGTYTLLPRRYALLPGAFLVTPQSGATIGNFATPEGTELASGFTGNAFSQRSQDPQSRTQFEIAPPDVVSNRVKFDTFRLNQFLVDAAERLNIDTVQRMPADSGYLSLHGNSAIQLEGTVLATPSKGARGALVDISSFADIEIRGESQPATGRASLRSSVLTGFGADSLLVGGLRRFTSAGTTVEVRSQNVTVNNAGSPLSSPEVILAANGRLTMAEGSAVLSSGSLSQPAALLTIGRTVQLKNVGETISFSSPGTVVTFAQGTPGDNRITSNANGTITLANGTTLDLVAGTATALAAGSTVSLSTPGTITFSSGTGGAIPLGPIGDGAIVRVSGDSNAEIVRSSVSNSTLPLLDLRSGATVSGNSVLLDSTSGFLLARDARLSANALALGAGQISLLISPPVALTGEIVPNQLVVAGSSLADIQNVRSLKLKTYQQTIDLYGPGAFGSSALGSLLLETGAIRGFNQGAGTTTLAASFISLSNPRGLASPTPLAPTGRLSFNADTIQIGSGQLNVTQFDDVVLSAPYGIRFEGSGGFTAQKNLTAITSLMATAQSAQQSFSAGSALGGILTVHRSNVAPTIAVGSGGSLTLNGAAVSLLSDVRLPSGSILVRATTGDLVLGGRLDVEGTAQSFFDIVRFTDAGDIRLTADAGNIALLAGSNLSVSANPGGGNAGRVFVRAANGAFSSQGSLTGAGGSNGLGGSVEIDSRQLSQSEFESLRSVLNAGGFTESRDIRVRLGSLTITGTIAANNAWAARNLVFSTDSGDINVSGDINASGLTGGKITLAARGNVTLNPGSLLTVRGQQFSAAGKGGEVRLEAGAVDALTGNPNLAAFVTTAGATVDLGVDAFVPGDFETVGSSAFYGRFTGKLNIRAPRGTATTVNVNPLSTRILGASAIVVEGFRVYSPGGGTLSAALRNTIFGTASATPGLPPTGGDNNAFMAGEAAMRTNLLSLNPALAQALVVAPGVEIINRTGNVTLGTTGSDPANDWDLAGFRYGSSLTPGVLTIRAFGNLSILNALSDGFAGNTVTQTNAGLTNGQKLWLATLMPINPLLPTNSQSWSYRLVAGADIAAADFLKVRPATELTIADTGSLKIGNFYTGNLGGSGESASTALAISPNGSSSRFQVVRTGTGDISIAAARDVQLRNQFATIYTAGVRIPDATKVFALGDFSVPLVEQIPGESPDQPSLGAVQQPYPAQWAMAGGNVVIRTQRDIRRITQVSGREVTDSSRQLPSNWLYRRGFVDSTTGKFGVGGVDSAITTITDPSASTTWWIDYSNFFEGIGALGGGDVRMIAGRDIVNADAFVPTNARMPGLNGADRLAPDASRLLQYGGGDLFVRADNNIDGGVYYVERGKGTLFAGNQITTNSARNPGVTLRDSLTWLPTTLFLGAGRFDVAARGNVLLGPVSNAFLLPIGLNNKFWYKTYFQTFSPDAEVNVASYGGSVTHRLSSVLATGTAPSNTLQGWLSTQNLFTPTSNAARGSQTQPWIRLGEAQVSTQTFGTILTISPPTLRSTAFAGNVNIVGSSNLFPSGTGTVELLASDAIVGLNRAGPNTARTLMRWVSGRINLSDSDPAKSPGIVSPFAYQSAVGRSAESLIATPNNFLSSIDILFNETGSYSGRFASVDIKQALHASTPVHANDSSPLRIYARTGDISGLTLFSSKAATVLAEQDITDVAFYIQNARANDVTIVSAGRDIIPYNASSPLRSLATSTGNTIADTVAQTTLTTVTGGFQTTNVLTGDIQISGPGVLEVLAGRDLDLGTGPNRRDGTAVGITSIGNFRNPALPFAGADIIGLAGVSAAGGLPAIGLSGSTLKIDSFVNQYIIGGEQDFLGLRDSTLEKLGSFAALSKENQAVVALDVFFAILRQAAEDSVETDSYDSGYAAIDTLFSEVAETGEIRTRARNVRTSTGGSISLLAPAGGLTLASNVSGSPLTPPGIVTEFGGSVSTFTDGSVDIGQSRIFTLRGGDITMWSSTGDIAAGTASKTVVTAPPTRVVIDATSASVQTDLGGLATGGGIGVLAAVEGVTPASVYLIAPLGTVDAGDAGIRATGNITIAAAEVLNADNIAAGGISTGVPSAPVAAAPNISGLTSGSSTTAASSAAADQVSQQSRQQPTEADSTPSIITVEVLGYGGDEDDVQ